MGCWSAKRKLFCCCLSIESGVIFSGIFDMVAFLANLIFLIIMATKSSTSNYNPKLFLIGLLPNLILMRLPRIVSFIMVMADRRNYDKRNIHYKIRVVTMAFGMAFSLIILIIIAVYSTLLFFFLYFFGGGGLTAFIVILSLLTYILIWAAEAYLLCMHR